MSLILGIDVGLSRVYRHLLFIRSFSGAGPDGDATPAGGSELSSFVVHPDPYTESLGTPSSLAGGATRPHCGRSI